MVIDNGVAVDIAIENLKNKTLQRADKQPSPGACVFPWAFLEESKPGAYQHLLDHMEPKKCC